MKYYADLHVHSHYSRATGRDADLEHFSLWARKKGLAVVGTGDFTHPAWFRELREQLVPAEPGLFRLRPEVERALAKRLPAACAAPARATRFLLEVEIATIYKQGDRTRKVHHLLLAPDFEQAERLTQKLARIGNLASDGRPILGLNARHLLELTLEAGPGCFLIPAHIWTPWFSALGSKSGFDTIEECYGDLAPRVFALETGLSSDPAMNWRVSGLDRYRLVSNSDAHSPGKLGREACVFDGDLNYFALRRALETGAGYAGTVEFFPEEGKYHLDGHRKCNVCFTPDETRRAQGRCPVCGKPLTVGVMNRVEELADRPDGAPPAAATPFRSFIPLAEILSELSGTGPASQKVERAYEGLLAWLGPELFILGEALREDLARIGSDRLAEAIMRMRGGRVRRQAGYDGEYGVIRLFNPDELTAQDRTGLLLDVPPAAGKPTRKDRLPETCPEAAPASSPHSPAATDRTVREPAPPAYGPGLFGILDELDPEQRAAAEIASGPLLIVAGPGTGKTRTLTHRLAHLVISGAAAPTECLAFAFTNRAAEEMRGRLQRLLPGRDSPLEVTTFHAFGYGLVRKHHELSGLPPAFRIADEDEAQAVLQSTLTPPSKREARRWMKLLAGLRRSPAGTDDGTEPSRILAAFRRALRARGLLDFDDLIRLPVELLDAHPELAAAYRARYRWIAVDEYQDIDACQYRLLRQLAPADGNLCVIGDPDQAIYGFRGTDTRCFQRFAEDFPAARAVRLTRNYRSGRAIVTAARQAIAPASLAPGGVLTPLATDSTPLVMHTAATDKAEAEFVVHTIEELIGGASFFARDSGRVAEDGSDGLAFADFAVLYRTDAQSGPLAEALARSGLPFQKRSHARLAESPAAMGLIAALRALPGDAPLEQRFEQAAAAAGGGDDPDTGRVVQALRPLVQRCADVNALLSELALTADIDLWDPRAECISLLTLHASKGLEFPVVFIVGCEDGLLPLRWGDADTNLDEERRLLFVGMTRARRRLFLTHAQRRLWRGQPRAMDRSPFLQDIEERLLEHRRAATVPRRARPAGEQLPLF